MKWIVPENKLDDQQREFIDNVDINQHNVWIKGFPGSGKSVLLAYTLKKIKGKNPNASVVLVVFTHSLIAMFKEAFREMGISVSVVTFYQFMNSSSSYDYILCDEVQDFVPIVLREMNNHGKHIVVSGDENQSIYDRDPKYMESTVSSNQIRMLLSVNEYELGIIHRLSRNIINVVQRFLPNMNIFSAKQDMSKMSTQVRLCEANSPKEEADYIMKEGKKTINVGDTAAILIPKQEEILSFINTVLKSSGKSSWAVRLDRYGKPDYDNMNSYLDRNGIPIQYVGNRFGSFSNSTRKITLMTYHSAKGLDFDSVFIPGLNNSLFINSNETLSKTLFMVAMTRSRNNLYLLYSGYKHPYLKNFESECNKINVHDYLNGQIGTISSTNRFGF